MSDIPAFLKKDGDSLLFNLSEGYFAFYVPEAYFEKGTDIALIVGEYVNLIGVLDYAIFDKNGKNSGLKHFRFPTIFLSQPTEIVKIKNVKLTESCQVQDYRILKYYKDAAIVVSTKVPKGAPNIEEFYKLFLYGKLPNTIPYDELQNYFLENINLNGGKYSVSTQLIGVVISEMFRDKKDMSKPFRLSNAKNMTDYSTISIQDIPKYISPFTSITSNNWDEAVINAIENKDGKYSPMENILTT